MGGVMAMEEVERMEVQVAEEVAEEVEVEAAPRASARSVLAPSRSRTVAATSAFTCFSTALCHASTSGAVPLSSHASSSCRTPSLARSRAERTCARALPRGSSPSTRAKASITARSDGLIFCTQLGRPAGRPPLLPAARGAVCGRAPCTGVAS